MGLVDKLVGLTVAKTVGKVADSALNFAVAKTAVSAAKLQDKIELHQIQRESKKLENLKRLQELRDSGAITEREFKREKKKLLNK